MTTMIGGNMKIIGLLAILVSASSFGYEFGANVPENVKNQIVQDLKFMQNLQGSDTSGIHKEIFGELKGSNYVDWFEKRVTSSVVVTNSSPTP